MSLSKASTPSPRHHSNGSCNDSSRMVAPSFLPPMSSRLWSASVPISVSSARESLWRRDPWKSCVPALESPAMSRRRSHSKKSFFKSWAGASRMRRCCPGSSCLQQSFCASPGTALADLFQLAAATQETNGAGTGSHQLRVLGNVRCRGQPRRVFRHRDDAPGEQGFYSRSDAVGDLPFLAAHPPDGGRLFSWPQLSRSSAISDFVSHVLHAERRLRAFRSRGDGQSAVVVQHVAGHSVGASAVGIHGRGPACAVCRLQRNVQPHADGGV